MRKILSLFLTLLVCVTITGCNNNKALNVYKTVAAKYIDGIGTMSVDEARAFAESNNLEFNSFYEDITYKIPNDGRWEALIEFKDGKINELSFYDWDNDQSVVINSSEIYCILNGNLRNFDSVADCEKYVWGGTTGIDFTVEKKEKTSSSRSTQSNKPSGGNSSSSSISLRYGKLLSKTVNGSTLVIKAKIEPSYNNKATVDQNYYNIENIIKKQGGDKYTEIQYWAVADMTNGSEQKVISFTVSEAVIKKIVNDQIVANQMGNYVDDLFIHASLR